jgi:hypothetical protein
MTETKPTAEAELFRAFANAVVAVPKAAIDRRVRVAAKLGVTSPPPDPPSALPYSGGQVDR